jgi:hypothetical protein
MGWRLLPCLDGIDGVPAMLLVVTQAAVESDPSAYAGRRKRNSGNDLSGSERTARVHQPHTPPAGAATAHSEDATDDGDSHTAKARVVRPTVITANRLLREAEP